MKGSSALTDGRTRTAHRLCALVGVWASSGGVPLKYFQA
jgi:hypothetical protein